MNTIHDLKRSIQPSLDMEVVCAGHEQHNGNSGARRPEVIAIKNLRIEYKSREMRSLTKLAVKDLSLSVHAGEVFGFLGPNGAGKTSTMNVLLGEGLRHLPDHPALQFELGRIHFSFEGGVVRYNGRKDLARARNIWEHAVKSWHEQEASKPDPDKFILEQILSHVAKLEEEAGNIPAAISYWEQVKILMPEREGIPQRIKELQENLAASAPR